MNIVLKRKSLLGTAVMLLFPVMLRAQQVMNLYTKGIPNSIPSSNMEKKTARANGADWLSNVSEPTLTYYPAKVDTGLVPAVVICPGGGYGGLSIVREGTDVALELNKNGIAAFVLKYRLPDDKTMSDKTIGPLQDAQQAIVEVRKNAAKWRIDPNKIGIVGFSAGGHLASTAGTHFNQAVIANGQISIRPDFMVLLYPVVSFSDSLVHWGSRENLIGKTPTPSKVELYSNELQVTDQTPRAFIVHAGDDQTVKVENSIRFYEALHRHKVNAALLLYPRGGHGFGLNNPTTKDRWMEHCIQWMKSEGFY